MLLMLQSAQGFAGDIINRHGLLEVLGVCSVHLGPPVLLIFEAEAVPKVTISSLELMP